MTIHELGPYEIQNIIGRGGMGMVYLGVEKQSGLKVAVKVLSPSLCADEAFRTRFEAEIQSLEKLRHPHVVQLYGFGEQDGHLFYAMQLVEGSSLQEELSSGRRFEWREVVQYGIDVCSALKHAHDHGIIHRDIKPANLLIDQQDHVRLADFGIAKLFGEAQHTAAGGVLGTADYMAPEQAEGLAVTSKCDLYSLGAVLYALLAGRAPFQGKSLPEVVHKVRFDPPLPVRRFAAETPEELERLVDQLLAKDPQRRVPTALAISKRLQAIQRALTVHPDMDATIVSPAKTGTAAEDGAGQDTPGDGVIAAAAEEDTTSVPPKVPGDDAERGGIGDEPAPNESAEDTSSRPSSRRTPARFTTVDEDYRRRIGRHAESRESRVEFWSKWIGLVALIALLGGLIWHFSRDMTADELLQRIRTAASGGEDKLVAAQDDMQKFMDSFPDDPRRDEVERHLRDVQLVRADRRLEVLSRRRMNSKTLSALERLLLKARYLEAIAPHESAARLRALLDVYAGCEQLDQQDQLYIELARRRLTQLQDTLQTSIAVDQELLEQRVEHARKLAKSDPAAAEAIWCGIIELYADQTWAKEFVDEARIAVTNAR